MAGSEERWNPSNGVLCCTACSSHHPGLALGAPPSTRMHVPVMKLAAGDNKKTTATAASASVPKRCKGIVWATLLRMKSVSLLSYVSSPLDAMEPGAMVLTRTPAAAHSVAADSL